MNRKTAAGFSGGSFFNPPVIRNRAAVKDPVNRTPSVAIRDPSLALRMTVGFVRRITSQSPPAMAPLTRKSKIRCHPEERSDEGSRK